MAPLPAEIRSLCDEAAARLRPRLGGGRLYLYGSWARGDAVERSDIDLAVEGPAPYDPAVLAAAGQDLDDLPTLRGVSLVDLAAVEPGFRAEVLLHARPL